MLKAIRHNVNVLESVATSSFTAWRGCLVVKAAEQPEKPLVLYDMEACPYCRRVREALTSLHLDVDIRPCPKGGKLYRPEAEAIGGKQMFPLLVDENTGKVLYESADIVEYLFREYGKRPVPKLYQSKPWQPALSSVGSGVSELRGMHASPGKRPEQALHLWSFEGSPFSRLVREKLCEMEIPYTLHNIGKEHWTEIGPARQRIKPGAYQPQPGGKRDAFFQQHGRVQVPYLEDPNTGEALFESSRILKYLDATYGG
ncbi:MAG: glutathione S-transferase [Gammaproteobacteria bacterium]|uniref:Glutaredoxin n=1 Tax=Marinobacter nitratireducens TaxID=1137280 RepID=A0A072N022_9GAMM|nr:glutathione S-transferase N-terminal domain-containing protein [Marinobacter nitratireducens]KEF31019.1 Glutaredoxin [Marinobacter nitratireducens]TNE76190.1 MAG: glutathione S-transferase [Gammaproteobacteria bacterium]TNE96634.1 MAG: glutathione S-transferase [Gammaproteobacteria bacterium]